MTKILLIIDRHRFILSYIILFYFISQFSLSETQVQSGKYTDVIQRVSTAFCFLRCLQYHAIFSARFETFSQYFFHISLPDATALRHNSLICFLFYLPLSSSSRWLQNCHKKHDRDFKFDERDRDLERDEGK